MLEPSAISNNTAVASIKIGEKHSVNVIIAAGLDRGASSPRAFILEPI